MSTRKSTASPFKRFKTKNRGITYRVSASGARTYHVSHAGTYHAAPNEKDAIALQAEFRARVAKGEQIVTPTKLTFAEITEKWWTAKSPRLRESTQGEYRRSLDNVWLPNIGSRKIGSITVDDIADLLRGLDAKGLKPSTIRAYQISLARVFEYATRKKLIPVNPYSQLTADDRPHHPDTEEEDEESKHDWNDGEMQALVDAAEYLARQPCSRCDYSPPIRTTLQTGLRIAELLGLKRLDFSYEKVGDKYKGEFQVRRQWLRVGKYVNYLKTKSSRRTIPLPDDLVRYLIAYKLKSRYSADEDPIFAGRDGRPLGHRNLTGRGLERAAAHAGIEGISFHDLRHCFASRMIHLGMDAVRLAARLGHKDATITLRVYAHLYDAMKSDDEDREIMSWATN